jgi:hypothetical protein
MSDLVVAVLVVVVPLGVLLLAIAGGHDTHGW